MKKTVESNCLGNWSTNY